MKEYIKILEKSPLFAGVDGEEILSLLSCMGASKGQYKKGEYIYIQGDTVSSIAILVEGQLHIQSDDYWGNRSIISLINAGDMFGEAYLSENSGPILNDVVAVSDSTVIFLNLQKILTTCQCGCSFHSSVIKNLVFAIAEKNRSLVNKLGCVTKRTTREKLICYLSNQAKLQNSSSFSVPFNRQQMADFLSVDRSAMSNELCKMRDEGLLIFKKNQFTLL
ncbi:MAG: Crp/Fnr family transcriptional regulator [Clostridia bacterium]|nr:Crp/Fnr family transcriptional regulator [Clostridia bacterium]